MTILTNSRGLPWTEDGFRSSWDKAFKKAKLGDLHFHDLRGTAVTRRRWSDARCRRLRPSPVTQWIQCSKSSTPTTLEGASNWWNRQLKSSMLCTDDEQISQTRPQTGQSGLE